LTVLITRAITIAVGGIAIATEERKSLLGFTCRLYPRALGTAKIAAGRLTGRLDW
jgi:hypothetical protein